MFSVPVFRFTFTSSWKMLCLTLIGIAIFVRLGFWQLHREAEKRQLLQAYHSQMNRQAVNFPGVEVQQYQPVIIRGHYLPMVLLLDNQHHDHRFGYDVLSALLLDNGEAILVDRGWVAADLARVSFPKVSIPSHAVEVRGRVYFPSTKQWVLGPTLEKKTNQLAIVEALDTSTLSQFLHKSLYPFIIRQSEDTQGDYLRDWVIVSTAPERHRGYALQWFVFAAVLGIIYIGLNLKKTR